MTHLLELIRHAGFGVYGIAFIVAATESLAFVGLFVPGTVIVLGLGALAMAGPVSLWKLVIAGIAGAIVGDGISYEWGHAGGRLFGRRLEKHRQRGEKFFRRHGALSILIGRFVGPARPIIPFVAGTARMSRLRFYVVNVASAVAWSLSYFGAGYVFGSASHALLVTFGRGAILLGVAAVGIGGIVWGTRLAIRFRPHAYRWVKNVWERAMRRPRVEAFVRKHPRLVAFAAARMTHTRFTGLPLTMIAIVIVYVAVLLAGLAEDYVSGDPITAVDRRVATIGTVLRTPGAVRFFFVVTQFGGWIVSVGGAAALAILLWRERQRVLATGMLATLVIAQLGSALAKIGFRRPRPDELYAVIVEDSFSFPSGHATSAAALFGFLAYLVIRSRLPRRSRTIAAALIMCVIVLIDLSRILLGVHYVSDVLAGNLLGFLAALTGIAIIEWRHELGERVVSVQPRIVASMVVVLLLLATAAVVVEPQPIVRVQPRPVSVMVTADVAGLIASGKIAAQTETLVGGSFAPITVILAGERPCINATLIRSEWQLARKPSAGALSGLMLARVAGRDDPEAPVIPTFYENRAPDLAFTPAKPAMFRRRHLRVWQLPYRTEAGDLFVGSATDDGEFSLEQDEPWTSKSAAATDALVAALRSSGDVSIGRIAAARTPIFLGIVRRCY